MLVKVVRVTGWTLITVGVLIVLYLVYLLFWTNLETRAAQQDMRDEFQLDVAPTEPALPGEEPDDDGARRAEAPPVDPGDAYAALWFERPGTDEPVVHEEPLMVVEGVSLDMLRRGPGHYPDTAAPGQDGNFAVSGHRTTYGAPFFHLDELRPGDEVHVVDRERREWVYVVQEQRIVQPTELWVVGPDPLDTGAPTLTLTTCNPRFSAAERLIVFAELADDQPTTASSPRAT